MNGVVAIVVQASHDAKKLLLSIIKIIRWGSYLKSYIIPSAFSKLRELTCAHLYYINFCSCEQVGILEKSINQQFNDIVDNVIKLSYWHWRKKQLKRHLALDSQFDAFLRMLNKRSLYFFFIRPRDTCNILQTWLLNFVCLFALVWLGQRIYWFLSVSQWNFHCSMILDSVYAQLNKTS